MPARCTLRTLIALGLLTLVSVSLTACKPGASVDRGISKSCDWLTK